MTELILIGIVVLALATLYIGLRRGSNILFDQVCNVYLFFAAIHGTYSIVGQFTFNNELLNVAAPFVLGYGPFIYIGFRSLEDKFSLKSIALHFVPFLVFLIVYVVMISNAALLSEYLMSFYITQYSVVAMSLFGYALWLTLTGLGYGNIRMKKQLALTSFFTIGFIVSLFSIVIFTGIVPLDAIKGEMTGLVIYSGIFSSVLLIFVFRVNNTFPKEYDLMDTEEPLPNLQKPAITAREAASQPEVRQVVKPALNPLPVQKYNKSALSPAVLDDYKNKLEKLVGLEKIYLDNELTLEVLAKKMRMPMHHLTQLFNVYLGENFNQYINRHRVNHACELLRENDGSLSMEQVAFNSGFNSKVSFNRHFKIITGLTPKEYTYKHKSTDI